LTGKQVILTIILGTCGGTHLLAPELNPVAKGLFAADRLQTVIGTIVGE
jgi:hypothetical protein